MKKVALNYGILSGILIIVLSLFNWLFFSSIIDYQTSEFFGYISIIAALLTIPMGIKYFKEQVNEQLVSFKEATLIGLSISTISASFMYVYSALFFGYNSQQFMEWSKANMSTEEWDAMQQQLATLPSYFVSPWFQGFVMFLTVLIIGVIITLISAWLLSKRTS